MVVALEPTEALRVLKEYGNPGVKVITNTRAVYSVAVICGDAAYPELQDLKGWMHKLSASAWFIDATDEAVKLGTPILSNVLLVGALAAVGDLPLSRDRFREVMARTMPPAKVEMNVTAFDKGMAMIG